MEIGILIFDGMTLLDAAGPAECLARIPGARVRLVARSGSPVSTEHGFVVHPDIELGACPRLDILVVPGGPGINALLMNDAVIGFLRDQASGAKYTTSICTGSLLLGAAGLLRGKRAACHWLSLPLLELYGALPSSRRVEIDGNLITAGGITAGIDFGLVMVERCLGTQAAEEIQLLLQYDPQPPLRAGTPAQAGPTVTSAVTRARQAAQDDRARLVALAAARLGDERQL